MSESNATYQEIDLDNLPANPQLPNSADEFEIVEESAATADQPAPAPSAPQPASTAAEADDDGDEGSEPQAGERKRLTRSQRLKSQRDLYAQQLNAAQQEIESLRTKASRFEADSVEAANIGMDFYIQTIDSNIRALRSEFDAAYDAGDRTKIFEVQQRMAELTADKKNAEREKRSIPRAAGPTNKQPGSATPPTAAPNQIAQPQPRQEAVEWASRNQEWFNKDRVMTVAAYTIDQTLVQEGYSPSDPDYFEELDKRIRNEFPHKFRQGTAAPPSRPSASPTVQNRASSSPVGGKVRVVITPEDRRFAEQLGLDIQTYAREKVKRDRSLQTATQYTEII
jgi:hypothetical protein